MASGKVQMAKVHPEKKTKLKEIADSKGVTMSYLVKAKLRDLLLKHGLPTI
jgi:DNA-binding IscR family transcriptional regulator